jgi:hypothetical protein
LLSGRIEGFYILDTFECLFWFGVLDPLTDEFLRDLMHFLSLDLFAFLFSEMKLLFFGSRVYLFGFDSIISTCLTELGDMRFGSVIPTSIL